MKMTQKEADDWADIGMQASIEIAHLRGVIRYMAEMLAEHEWAEHLSDDPDLQELELQITALIGKVNFPAAATKENPCCAEKTTAVDGMKGGCNG